MRCLKNRCVCRQDRAAGAGAAAKKEHPATASQGLIGNGRDILGPESCAAQGLGYAMD